MKNFVIYPKKSLVLKIAARSLVVLSAWTSFGARAETGFAFNINQIEPELRSASRLLYPAKGEFLRDAADLIEKIPLATKADTASAARRVYALQSVEKFFAKTDSEFSQQVVKPALSKSSALYAKVYAAPTHDLNLDLGFFVSSLRALLKRANPEKSASLAALLHSAAPLMARAQGGTLNENELATTHEFFAEIKSAQAEIASSPDHEVIRVYAGFEDFWKKLLAYEGS